VVLRGVSPLIWRRLLVRSDSSIADLHATLQLAFGWSDEHLSPSHGGVTAAIAAAPEADVVFVAHTLFEVVGTVTHAWRRIPLQAPDVGLLLAGPRGRGSLRSCGGGQMAVCLVGTDRRLDRRPGGLTGPLR